MDDQSKDGGAAFPRPKQYFYDDMKVQDFGSAGMSLRDWFAGQALAGLMARTPTNYVYSTTEYAKAAYNTADAMLKIREQEGKQ